MGIALFMQATPTYQIPRCIPRTVNFRATRRFWLQWLAWSVILRQSNCSQQRPLTESLGYSTQESRRILLPWNWVNTKKFTDFNIQLLILLSHHRAVYGTLSFRSFHSKLAPHYLFSRNRKVRSNRSSPSPSTSSIWWAIQAHLPVQAHIWRASAIEPARLSTSNGGLCPMAFTVWGHESVIQK